MNLSPQITTAKRAGGMAKVVQHLPGKYKALSLVPLEKKKGKYCFNGNLTVLFLAKVTYMTFFL
jgi:hypothetical protein